MRNNESEIRSLAAEDAVACSKSRYKYEDTIAARETFQRGEKRGVVKGKYESAPELYRLGVAEETIKKATGFSHSDFEA